MRIGVIGTGHVGLVTCVTLASLGHEVVGTDDDHEKVTTLEGGRVPFYEPGLTELLAETAGKKLHFARQAADAVAGSEVVFICVGTPPRASGEANLVAVELAARAVARHATGPTVVAEKSTVPTGTAQRLARTLRRENRGLAADLEVVSNPEFLREGHAIDDALHPERILVGAESPQAFETMRRVYVPLIERGVELIETDMASAELAKHAYNAFLALKISFANALARICERAGGDIGAVVEVMGRDKRIGRAFLDAGLGYGGSCFPKDLAAFDRIASTLGYDFPLLKEVSRINDEAVQAVADKIKDALWNLENKTVALLGLAFKPGTDDVRFAPALVLARKLLEEGARVVGYDPHACANAKADVPKLEIAPDPYEAAAGAHCLVLCTQWDEFSHLDLHRLNAVMEYPVVVDGRNFFDVQQVIDAGLAYYPIGRAPVID